MSDFHEAADAFRTAQLQRLTAELQSEKAAHCVMRELAVDRGERIIECARLIIELQDQRKELLGRVEVLSKDADRYQWLRVKGGKSWACSYPLPEGVATGVLYDVAVDAVIAKEKGNV